MAADKEMWEKVEQLKASLQETVCNKGVNSPEVI